MKLKTINIVFTGQCNIVVCGTYDFLQTLHDYIALTRRVESSLKPSVNVLLKELYIQAIIVSRYVMGT